MALVMLLACAPLMGVPFLFSFAVIVMALLTLRHGALEGFVLLLCAAAPALVWYLHQGSATQLVHDVLLGALPVWFLASVLCVTQSWRLMLCWGSLLMALLTLLLSTQLFGFMIKLFMPFIAMFVHGVAQSMSVQPDVAQLSAWVQAIMMRMPGIWMLVSAMLACMLLLVARTWQSYLYNPGGLRRELMALRMGWPELAVFILVFTLAMMGMLWAQNVAIVLVLPFAINGLVLVHVFAERLGRKSAFILVGLYVMMVFFVHVVMFCLLVIGLLDSMLDMRSKQRGG